MSAVRDCHDPPRGISSSGRAPALQAGGDRFESDILHQHFATVTQWIRVLVYETGSRRFESFQSHHAPVDKLAKSSLSKGEILLRVQLPPGVPNNLAIVQRIEQ